MDRQPTLEGETLLLRPLREEDRAALYAVASDPELWAQHPISNRWQEDVFGEFFDEAMREGGALAVVEKASGTIIGSSQIRPSPLDPKALEIGWTFLARAHWGGGANAEMKRLMVAHLLGQAPRALFRVGEANIRSRRAMEKIGGRLTDEVERAEHDGRAICHLVYEITPESFAGGPLGR